MWDQLTKEVDIVIHIQIPTCKAFAVIMGRPAKREKNPFVQQYLTDHIAPWLVFTLIV